MSVGNFCLYNKKVYSWIWCMYKPAVIIRFKTVIRLRAEPNMCLFTFDN